MTAINPPVIDIHTHAFNDELAKRVVLESENKTRFKANYNATVAGLLEHMQDAGVETAVIQPIATKKEQVPVINHWAASLMKNDKLICFGALHPEMSDLELDEAIMFFKRHGFKGVKLHAEYQSFFPDAKQLNKIYSKLADNQLILLLHAGRDLCFEGEIKAVPKRLLAIHQAFPELKMIAAHLGGFQMWDEVEKMLAGENIFFDTAFCAGQCSLQQFERIVRHHGSDKILFGSDAPWGDQKKHIEFIRQSHLSEQEKHRILGLNALQLLGL